MFIKYEKTPHVDQKGKFFLSKKEIQALLAGEVVIEEKMDGANAGIIRHKSGFHLQKRGSLVGQSEHEQFGYFHNWANVQNYEKIMAIPVGYLVYGELLRVVHTIVYDSLPDYFLVFDVWDGDNFLNYKQRQLFCSDLGFHMVPLIATGNFTKNELFKMIPKESAYGSMAEGIVVKRYSKNNYIRAKIVKPNFIQTIEESDHWTHGPIRINKLKGT